ncbi:MAG: FecR family protein [Gammaproteobacteria bacterium]
MHSSHRSLRTFLAVLIIGMMLPSLAMAADGRIAFVLGGVTVNGEPAKRGTPVEQGDEIRAAIGANALVVMKDKTTLRVASDSTVRIKEYSFDEDQPATGKVVVALARGTLRFISGLINKRKPGASSVTTPVATMGIRGSDGVFTYAPASGDFVVQFNRGSGVMSFFDNTGAVVATVNVPTNQRSRATIGQPQVVQEPVVPDTVTAALNNSKNAAGEVDQAAAQQQVANLDPVDRMIFLAVAATQEDQDTGTLVGAIAGAVSGADASENAAGAVFVANLLDPGNAGDHTREALENINAGQGGATADDAREVVRAAAEAGRQDGEQAANTAVDMGLLSRPEAQQEIRDVTGDTGQGAQPQPQQNQEPVEETPEENPSRDSVSPS